MQRMNAELLLLYFFLTFKRLTSGENSFKKSIALDRQKDRHLPARSTFKFPPRFIQIHTLPFESFFKSEKSLDLLFVVESSLKLSYFTGRLEQLIFHLSERRAMFEILQRVLDKTFYSLSPFYK